MAVEGEASLLFLFIYLRGEWKQVPWPASIGLLLCCSRACLNSAVIRKLREQRPAAVFACHKHQIERRIRA